MPLTADATETKEMPGPSAVAELAHLLPVSSPGAESSPQPRPSLAAGPGPTASHQKVGQNVGMLVGGAIGVADGDGLTKGMVTGGVVGGIVGQRLAQAEKHAYWRGQAAEYRADLAAGQPPLSEQAGGGPGGPAVASKPHWWSRNAREQRRLRRWERRAERRDRTALNTL